MKRWPVFPRSLRQLVMMAFLLILLPLLILAWQAWQSLNALSAQAALTNRTTLIDARRSEAMTNAALEMERSYRQYCVLDDRTLEKVYQNQRKRYSEMLDAHAGVLPDDKLYQALRQDLNDLAQLQCKNSGPDAAAAARLEAFANANAEMVQSTRAVIFSRGQQLQQEIAERGQFFGWQALVLFLVSLGLVLLFTRMIIGPVKGIQRMINRLGEGKSLGDTVAFKGPRELRSVGQRIIWLSERLSWLESQRHQFLRHISHELKTPMTTIAGYTDGILDGTIPPENEKQYLQIIANESRRLSRLVRRMLDVSQLQAMDPLRGGNHFDICESMRRVLISMEKKINDRHLDVDADIPDEPILVLGDNDMITQVIYNLLENAAKFAREGSTLYLGVAMMDGKARVTVRNIGDTIPAEELPLLFERFHKSDKSRSEDKDGYGLGLYIVKTILQQHKEEINVTSENGVTTFTFSLRVE